MANYANLKSAVANVIKTNGNQEITGAVLQSTLNNIISVIGDKYTFAGVATPSTNPGSPDQNVVYLAGTAGTYSNFSGLTVAAGEIAVFLYKGTWSKQKVYDDNKVVQATGTSTTNVMSQKAVTDELNKKVNESNVVQTTGASTTAIMSQKAVTDELNKKVNESNVVQTTGASTTAIMSQKAVTEYVENSAGSSQIVIDNHDVIYPEYTNGIVHIDGISEENDQYGYFSPVLLKQNETIILNNGSPLYLGYNVSTLYKVDANNNYLECLISRNTIGTSTAVVSYTNESSDYIYVGMCYYRTSKLAYRIVSTEALSVYTKNNIADIRLDIFNLKKDVTELLAGTYQYYDSLKLDEIEILGNYRVHAVTGAVVSDSDYIATRPIYLNAGSIIKISSGGNNFCAVGYSQTLYTNASGVYEVIIPAMSGIRDYIKYVIDKSGYYIFCGYNFSQPYPFDLTVYKQKVYDNIPISPEPINTVTPGFAVSVGADSVKSVIPEDPWFSSVISDGTTYGTYLDDKIDSIPQGDSFIFITDTHYKYGNRKNSAKLIDYVRRRLGIKTIIHGGDVENEDNDRFLAIQQWLQFNRDFVFRIGGDFKQVMGDHDFNATHLTEGQTPFTCQIVQKLMNGYNINELHYDRLYDEQIKTVATRDNWTADDKKEYIAWSKMHYFFDDPTINTRFIVLCTGWNGDTGFVVDKLGSGASSETNAIYLQMEFLYNTLLYCPNNYNIVIIGHNVVQFKRYEVNVGGSIKRRYNVNEVIWLGKWKQVSQMVQAYKNKETIVLTYRDWIENELKYKAFDFSSAQTPKTVICVGGDVHYDILAKSNNAGDTIQPIAEGTLEHPTVTNATISRSELLHVTTECDGADRSGIGIIKPVGPDYNDETDSISLTPPNTIGTLDSQAFDVVTMTDEAIYFTRIGAGNNRVVNIIN